MATAEAYGKWTVLRIDSDRRSSNGALRYICRCECGEQKSICGGDLRSGKTRSCKRCAATIHGHSSGGTVSPEYTAYRHMLRRCSDTTSKDWPNYGGRGIRVCDRWLESFANFLADMGARPSDNHSVDRINNDGNYEPGNCRWATRDTQNTNQRPRKRTSISINGTSRSLVEWLALYGIPQRTYYGRKQLGWSTEEAITTPIRKRVSA